MYGISVLHIGVEGGTLLWDTTLVCEHQCWLMHWRWSLSFIILPPGGCASILHAELVPRCCSSQRLDVPCNLPSLSLSPTFVCWISFIFHRNRISTNFSRVSWGFEMTSRYACIHLVCCCFRGGRWNAVIPPWHTHSSSAGLVSTDLLTSLLRSRWRCLTCSQSPAEAHYSKRLIFFSRCVNIIQTLCASVNCVYSVHGWVS